MLVIIKFNYIYNWLIEFIEVIKEFKKNLNYKLWISCGSVLSIGSIILKWD